MSLLPALASYTQHHLLRFDSIPQERKQLLQQLTTYVQTTKGNTHLNFICTHNSRRSHISQLWAQAAAEYYGIKNVHCYSGGTEATAFNPRAVKAMRDAGFSITQKTEGSNPAYDVQISDVTLLRAFSKTYNDPENPASDFCAVMTCSHADENCPFIPGAAKRIALTYNDPKEFDGTSLEEAKYAERVKEIGTELFYAFSLV